MMNEADTCQIYVLPKLKSTQWEDESIVEQMVLTPGRIGTSLDDLQAQVNALRGLQSASGQALSALLPSIPDQAFRGEM